MGLKKKLRTLRSVYKDNGAIGLIVVGAEYLQKKSRRKAGSKNKLVIDTDAIYEDILHVDFTKPANAAWTPPSKKKSSLTINWLMPPPGKGSGGHMTLWRFMKYFEEAGHVCRIYFHKPGPGSTVERVIDAMAGSFPELNAEMRWLQPGEEMESADVLFATSWQSAYTVYNSSLPAKKFYFVQDFEPFFYPIGGLSTLAENTYRMGLRGITAGGWLEKKLHDEFGMTTTRFDFGSDDSTYKFENTGPRKEIVFYARPTTPRRAFEFGVAVLDLFHQKHPEYVINFIGWDVADFNIPFPHKNLGILSRNELNEVYNRCAASLVMSLTNMSLLPLELLSAGCIPVVNDGPNNRLVSDNPYIAYCPSDPKSMADKLSEIVTRKNPRKHAQAAAESVRDCSWDESGKKVVSTVVASYNSPGSA